MTEPRFKARTWKRRMVKLSANKTVLHYSRGKPAVAKCGKCGAKLNGMPRLRQEKFSKLAKTEKRPERPYGGSLCSSCMREKMREKALKV